MKKKAMSLLLALALCLSLLPTATLAEDMQEAAQPVLAEQEPPVEEQEEQSVPEETETAEGAPEVPEAETVTEGEPDEAVLSVQAMIDALPGADELEDMNADELDAAYMAVQEAYEAYDALTAEQQEQITGADCFEELFGWFNEQVVPLDETIYPDDVNADGNIIASTGFSRNGPLLTASDTNLSGKYYIVKNDVTIYGDLTVDGSKDGGLILCKGATLTVTGALIHTGATSFFIYGQSDKGNNAGRLIIENSKDDGAAIRSTANNSQLCISSGELELHGGKSGKLVDKVRLYSTSVHKATLDGKVVLPAEWRYKSSISGEKLVIEYCKHDDADTVWIQDNDTQHHWQCKVCGFTSTAQVEHQFRPVKWDENTHTMKCDLCGYTADPAQHNWKTSSEPVATSDGKGHTTKYCKDCGYTSGESEAHTYDETGECTVCKFTPIAKDENDNLYDDVSIQDAIDAGVKELWLVSEATNANYKNILQESIEIGTGVELTLHMNGVKLIDTGNAVLTVSGGTLTVKDDAIIENTGKSQETVGPAIEVSGGKLTFQGEVTATAQKITETQTGGVTLAPAIKVTGGTVTFAQKLTATGGIYDDTAGNKEEQEPAVFASNGTLDFQGDLDLNGGLTLAGDAALVTKLTQGTFSAIKGDMSRISVVDSNTYNYIANLLVTGYAFADAADPTQFQAGGAYPTWTIGDLTIKKHDHDWKPDSTYGFLHSCVCGASGRHSDWKDGKCGVCDYACPHSSVTNDTSTGETIWKCATCHMPMTVQIENGSTKTFSTDFAAAMYNAINGTKITLLADIDNSGKTACITGDNTTVTLELNGHTINNGWIKVGRDQNGTINTSSTLKIIGSGSFMTSGELTVNTKATLDLSEWGGENDKISTVSMYQIGDTDDSELIVSKEMKGTIEKLYFSSRNLSTIKTKLNGGRYGYIGVTFNKLGTKTPFSSMLADGYVFQHIDTGAFEKNTNEFVYGDFQSISNVKVVKCPHTNMEPGADGTVTCKYCGTSGKFVASVDGNLYTADEWDNAFTDWTENGGTLKLYANYSSTASGDVTWESGEKTGATIDLNGHTMSIPNGGAFVPARNMSLTIKDTSEGQNGSISHVLLSKTNSYQSLTLESGNIGKLEVKGFVRVNIHGGSIDNLAVQDWHEGASFLIEGGSIGQYSLPEGKILADLLLAWTTYYCTNRDADLTANSRTETSKITFKPVPITLGSGTTTGEISFGGNIPFAPMMDTYGSAVDSYSVLWYRRTGSTVQLMETVTGNGATKKLDPNAFKDVKAGETLDVFCVIQVTENGSNTWQTAITGYKLKVLATDLSGDETKIEITDADGKTDNFVYSGQTITPTIKVSYNGIELTKGTDYEITADGSGADVKTYTLTITGKGNYGGSKEATWTIKPYAIGMPEVTVDMVTKAYDGTTDWDSSKLTTLKFPGAVDGSKTITLTQGTDFTLEGYYNDKNVGNDRSVTITVTLKNTNYTFIDRGQNTATYTFTVPQAVITKAAAPTDKTGSVEVMNNRANDYEFDLTALLPKLESPMEYGNVTYALGAINLQSDYYVIGTAKVEDGKLLLPIKAVPSETEQNIGTVTVTVSSGNIADFTLTLNVKATNKIVPTGAPKLSKDTLAWNETLAAITLSGAMNDGDTEVKGTFAWTKPATTPTSMDGFAAEWTFTPENTDVYAEVTDTVTIKVIKATPKGTPGYTKITTGGKTLADAKLTVGTITPEGTIRWELADMTVAAANTAYKWVFTPKDSEHYKELTGSITLYSVSSSGSSGGSGSSDRDDSRGVVKVETKTNPDGSATRTETLSNGTVTSTTTYPDGSTTKTTTKADGSSVTERREANGSTGTVTTDENGRTEVIIKVSEEVVSDAKRSGEAVKLPVSVKSEKNANAAPTVRIEMPNNAGETKVELPVKNVNSGTVAVLVHEDGTEEILKTGSTTKDGLQFTMNGTVTVKIIDNSKDFSDTWNHWAKDDVSFVTARGLFNGVSDSVFGVDRPMTRGMVNTVLARLAGVDTTPAAGQGAYDIGITWAKANGVSDGTNPSASVTREQLAAMLYRFSGSPEVSGSLSFSDAGAVSPYAKNALIWATQNGIVNGVSSERIDPAAQAKRAQVAAMMARYLKNLETN